MPETGNPLLPDEILPEDPSYDYGEYLPFRWSRDSQGRPIKGSEELAVPGFVRQMVNPLWLAAVAPANVAAGKYSSAQMNQLAPQAALGLLGLSPLGEAPEGALRVFAGVNARGADLSALRRAQGLETANTDPEEIWKQTGWFKDADNRWKWEIPDPQGGFGWQKGQARSVRDPETGNWVMQGPLPNIQQHPELLRNYPEFANIGVATEPANESYGGYWESTGKIGLSQETSESNRSSLMHELNHAVQNYESFARGGTATEWLPNDPNFQLRYRAARDQLEGIHSELQDQGINPFMLGNVLAKVGNGQELGDKESQLARWASQNADLVSRYTQAAREWAPLRETVRQAEDNYRATAGEVSSRNVQKRDNLATILQQQNPALSREEAYAMLGSPWQTAETEYANRQINLGPQTQRPSFFPPANALLGDDGAAAAVGRRGPQRPPFGRRAESANFTFEPVDHDPFTTNPAKLAGEHDLEVAQIIGDASRRAAATVPPARRNIEDLIGVNLTPATARPSAGPGLANEVASSEFWPTAHLAARGLALQPVDHDPWAGETELITGEGK